MIGIEDSFYTYEYEDYFKILPQINDWSKDKERIKNGTRVPEGFLYSSDTNKDWMTKKELNKWISKNFE